MWFTFAKIAFANDVAVFIPTNECVVRYVYDVRLTHSNPPDCCSMSSTSA